MTTTPSPSPTPTPPITERTIGLDVAIGRGLATLATLETEVAGDCLVTDVAAANGPLELSDDVRIGVDSHLGPSAMAVGELGIVITTHHDDDLLQVTIHRGQDGRVEVFGGPVSQLALERVASADGVATAWLHVTADVVGQPPDERTAPAPQPAEPLAPSAPTTVPSPAVASVAAGESTGTSAATASASPGSASPGSSPAASPEPTSPSPAATSPAASPEPTSPSPAAASPAATSTTAPSMAASPPPPPALALDLELACRILP